MGAHLLVVLLWCAGGLPGLLAAVPSLPGITCGNDTVMEAARRGVQHINRKQNHGFRFRLQEVTSSDYQQISGGCHIDVNVKLVQTKCHFTNPKPEDQCEIWRREERGAVATCSIEFWVMRGVAKVISHECTTRPELTNEEIVTICPECPKSLPLDDPTAVQTVKDAVVKFNREQKRTNYFTLMEVDHVTMETTATIGPIISLKFALVETTCPRGARNTFVACTPRCADIAQHAFCQISYYTLYSQLGELECELYPPKNPAPHPTGLSQFMCKPLFHQSPEACVCKNRLGETESTIHYICPFPLK
ncbi:alpha-2-HS-glycoprotein-like [Syngnathus typhle]